MNSLILEPYPSISIHTWKYPKIWNTSDPRHFKWGYSTSRSYWPLKRPTQQRKCFPSWTLSLSSLQNQMILLTQYHLSSSSPLNLVQIFVIKQDQGSVQLSLCKEVRRHHPPPLPLVATSPKNTLWPCGDHTQWVLWTNLLLGGLLSRCWDLS